MLSSRQLAVPDWAENQIIFNDKAAVEVLMELKPDFCLSDENIEAIIVRVDKIRSRGIAKGRAMLTLVLASAYLFTRYPRAHRRPYNPRKFANICFEKGLPVTAKELNRNARLFRSEDLYPPDPTPLTLFRMYWPYVSVEMNLPEKIKTSVEKILKLKWRSTGSPEVMIAGAIYIADSVCRECDRTTQYDLSKTFGITEVSIRNFLRRFEKQFSVEILL